jgi:hypothetical protein
MDENIAENQSTGQDAPDQPQPEVKQEQTDETQAVEISKNVRDIAAVCHLAGIVGFLGPLIVWLLKKDEHPFIDSQGRKALNFQLTILICAVILLMLLFTAYLLPFLFVANIIICVIACVKASDGKDYKYPAAISFLK